MERILICYLCKFGEYICYNSRDIEFFLGVPYTYQMISRSTISSHGRCTQIEESFDDVEKKIQMDTKMQLAANHDSVTQNMDKVGLYAISVSAWGFRWLPQ